MVDGHFFVDPDEEDELVGEGVEGQGHHVEAGQVPQLSEDQVGRDGEEQADS